MNNQTADEREIVIRDRREKHQFSIHNQVLDEWLPIIGLHGYAIYNLYVRLANQADERCFPGYTLIERHLGIGRGSISRYNQLLSICGLIHIEPGDSSSPNQYFILDIPKITPQLLETLAARVQAEISDRQFAAAVLARIEDWHPIQDHWRSNGRERAVIVHCTQKAEEGGAVVEHPSSPVEQGSSVVEHPSSPVEQGVPPGNSNNPKEQSERTIRKNNPKAAGAANAAAEADTKIAAPAAPPGTTAGLTSANASADAAVITVSICDGRALLQREYVRDSSPTVLLLSNFGIGPPNDRRILARSPDPDDVRAWMLYTLSPTQPGLNEPERARGYVIRRLLEGDEPPERFRRWARLTPDEWRALWRADRYGDGYHEALSPALAADFATWREDFAGLFPDGPLGDSGFDWTALQTALADRLGLPAFILCERREGEAVVEVWPPSGQVEDSDGWTDTFAERYDELVAALCEYGVRHRVVVVRLAPSRSSVSSPGCDPSVQARVKDDLTAEAVWRAALGELRLQMTQETFDAWLRESRLLKYEDGVFVVGVKSVYAAEWLEARLLPVVERTLRRLTGRHVKVRFEVAAV